MAARTPSRRSPAPATHAEAALDTDTPVPRRRGRPRLEDGPALDRDRLMEALMSLARREGLQALNMRRVAEELNVSPRLLYRHVADKDEMIASLSDAMLALHMPDLSSPDWEARLRALARASREAWAEFPGMAAEILARTATTYVDPHAVDLRKALRQALSDAGLSAEQVDYAHVQFAVLVMGGQVIVEGLQRDPGKPAIRRSRVDKSVDLGLDLLIFGIRRLATSRQG